MSKTVIAIDGPAASGKSTVARHLAERLGGLYVNTGDMYRTISWVVLTHGACPRTQPEKVAALLEGIDMQWRLAGPGTLELLLDGQPVPQGKIRAPEVARVVSFVACIPAVRDWLRPRQRQTRELGTVVMEGRDIGTVIFPDADYKFYVTAAPEVRARRRLGQAGETAPGADVTSVAAEIAERDRIDSSRTVAPLKPALDAVIVDTDELTIEQVVDYLVAHIKPHDRCPNVG